MNAQEFLSQVRIASPCLARWSDMAGDDRARFCGQCQKHVYNLSEMTTDEAAALIREKEGNLCGRFYQRSDGTMLTANCPVGVARSRRRVRRFALATSLGLFLGGGLIALGSSKGEDPGSKERSRLARAWDAAVWKVKDWFGLQPVAVTMGQMCVPLVRTNASSRPTPQTTSK